MKKKVKKTPTKKVVKKSSPAKKQVKKVVRKPAPKVESVKVETPVDTTVDPLEEIKNLVVPGQR